MIKHLFTQIWNLRNQNYWIVLELMVVFFVLLAFNDLFWIRAKTYFEPTGYDTENTYVLSLKELEPIASGYLSPEENPLTPFDELTTLVSRIETYPDIEYVSLSYHALPYSSGGVWNSMRVDSLFADNLRHRHVSPSYFDVFRIHTADGKPIHINSFGPRQVILSKDLAEHFFGNAQDAIGKQVWTNEKQTDEEAFRVIGVSSLYKRKEFNPYEKCFFEILTMPDIGRWLERNNVTGINICVRVKSGSASHFEQNFISDMGERLKENNLYVSSVLSSQTIKKDVVGKQIQTEILPMIYVVVFVLITVFLGVFGSFWLRTRQRKAEIGIRMAMGASKNTVWTYMIAEGLCLTAIAIVPGLLVYLNLLHAEILDVWRLPFSFSRVLIVFSSALFIACVMVVGGTSWPAKRAASTQPVDALRDE